MPLLAADQKVEQDGIRAAIYSRGGSLIYPPRHILIQAVFYLFELWVGRTLFSLRLAAPFFLVLPNPLLS
ncbi:hypothetical protein A3A69_02800 [candidate division WWE3 bacterium RIFCSPLOWO2_01_FULL_37_15]|uniref:Uncharacterized protein n=1 Tax=candidate division WWE3 bacterium RIFCSPLOWO2_01_FULL_37_15 TaxID=1802622 RepID=A0A1F4UTS2_UNCKA|nr:MAG: hypothetical protein A3A69_02800 [candidate division WWE3 bacterium RIFCSPLOWO2_01_FULL_37_15]